MNIPAELLENPSFGLLVTLVVWTGCRQIYSARPAPYTNPVFLSVTIIIALLSIMNIDYKDYNVGGNYIGFLLGPAVVALAVPLCKNIQKVRRNIPALAITLTAGSVTGILSAVLCARWLGADSDVVASLAPKSVTTPIAIGISEKLGGIAPLTAGIVIVTGMIGAMVGPEFIRMLRIKSRFALGLAIGMASHGIGTARVLEEDVRFDDKIASAMSGIGMTLNGIFTAVIAPVIMQFFQ